MNIQLDQKEIEAAICTYIEEKGLDISGKNIDIEFKAGRKGAGYSAAVTISPKGEIVAPTPITAVAKEDVDEKADTKESADEPLFG